MKYALRLICILLTIVFLTACMPQPDSFTAPADFYYLAEEIGYHVPDGVIRAEIRETSHFGGDLVVLLNAYLEGPATLDLVSPFPQGAQISDVASSDEGLCITVNTSFTSLSGIDLSLAANCLAMTAREVSLEDTIILVPVEGPIGGKDRMVISTDSHTLADDTATEYNNE